MAKKRQPTTAAANDDQPLTPASKNDQPPPSKKPEEEKVEEKDEEEVTSEEASSSEGEEEDDDDDDDDDEEDDEEEQTPTSKTAPPAKSESKKDEDNEDEEETDTDSDHEPPPKLKSINSKSIDETVKSKPQPKSTAAPARSGTKRSADEDTKQSKKKKTIAAVDDEKEKEKEKEVDNKKSGDDSKKLFQRVFTEDDELAIMKGLFDFYVKTGNDPLKYPTAFYDYVKKFIHFPVTLDQLKDKVRRLKLKFENKLKTVKNGKTPTFSKPIEEKMFEFGKKMWGVKTIEENGKPNEKPSKKELAVKKSPTTKKLVMEPDLPLVVSKETSKVGSSDGKENSGLILNEMERFDRNVSGVFGFGMDLLKSGVELIEESKRVELERRWKELRVAELKVVAMRAELAEEQSRLILDAMQSSSSD